MSTGVRVPLLEASAIAIELRRALEPGAERVEVAGSVRRRAPDVGDIELVVVPIWRTEVVPGLFEGEEQERNELDPVIDTLLIQGTLEPHPTDPKRGERYSKLVHTASGLHCDIFSASASTYGLILLIRTGPARYSQWLVTARDVGPRGMSTAALGLPFVRPEDRA